MIDRYTKRPIDQSPFAIADELLRDCQQLRLDILDDDPSVNYDKENNCLNKTVSSETVIAGGFSQYQFQNTAEWMGLSIIEVARKSILRAQLTESDQYAALVDLKRYFDLYQSAYRAEKSKGFHHMLALADHAREYVYNLFLEYRIIDTREQFNQLRNAAVMWRLFDRMQVDTRIEYPNQKNVTLQSKSWPLAYPEQDELLLKTASRRHANMNAADYIIKQEQKARVVTSDPIRLTTGSQERDWYASNAQVTTYQRGEGPKLVCWTNGDLRSRTGYYDNSLIKKLLSLNLKQLLLNTIGIQFTEHDQDKIQKFCQSTDVYGRSIHLAPICILDECQAYVDAQRFRAHTDRILRHIPMVEEEHQNLIERAEAIEDLNKEIESRFGITDFLVPINTPLAMHARKALTYHGQMKPGITLVTDRLISNYVAILGLTEQSAMQEIGLDLKLFNHQMQQYIQHPSEENFLPIHQSMLAIHQYAMRFHGQDFAQGDQVSKVVRSLSCLHDTMKHWQTYANSQKNYPSEVLNFSSGLMSSAALLGDATMINIKCKSGKDRTGVMLQALQSNFDYWSDSSHFKTTNGLPDLSHTFDVDQPAAIEQFKILLGSGAWPTAVAQDCQCPALKSLGARVSTSTEPNTLTDRARNIIGDGALTEKQRLHLGADLLKFHQSRSAYNIDFHKKVATSEKFKDARTQISSCFADQQIDQQQQKRRR